MKASHLATLKFFALLFLLPGLAGLILSAMISTDYMDTMPKSPVPEQIRIVPRNINGRVVYQTAAEDQRLTLIQDSSVGIFLVGAGLGLVYLEKWGGFKARELEEEEELSENLS
jgi:hypothetical protein